MDTKRSLSDGQQGKGGKERKTGEDQIPPNNPSTSDEEQNTSESWPGKIFNDPIHDHIEIPPLCVKIIDTPQFQRLRSIKQLGGTYFVYPGASHSRFEHSLGVCHLAGQLVFALKARQPDLGITDDDVMCLQIAGLCHDLGHGPFSHMFDNKFLPNMGIPTKHESLSVKMFNHMVEENNLDDEFRKYFREDLDKNKTFIKELIEGPSKNGLQVLSHMYEGRRKEKSFLYEIVANKRNGIDVDKWDYFARDCHMLGIKNSFDHTRSMKFARVLRVNDELQICFRNEEVENLYEMFHTWNKLHRQAYQHFVGNIVEIMISEAMQKADQHIRTPGKGGKMLSITETLDDMVAYEKLTDSIIDRIICSTDKNLEESREILMKVKTRQLYKCVGCIHPLEKVLDEETVKQGYVEILKKRGSKLGTGDVIIDHVFFNYGMKDKNPFDRVHFYKKDNPDKAIEVKKEEVSGMHLERFAEQQIRFYCKLDDNESLQQAKAAFTDWCKKNNCDLLSMFSSATPVEDPPAGQPKENQGTSEMTTYAKIQLIKTDGENTFGKKMTNRFRSYFNDLRLTDPTLPAIEIGYRFTHDIEMEERYRSFHVKVRNVITELANLLEDLDLDETLSRATKISQTWFSFLRNLEIIHRVSVCEVGWNNHITILVKMHKESKKGYEFLKHEVVSRFQEVYREIREEARLTAIVETLTPTEADDLRDTLRRNEG